MGFDPWLTPVIMWLRGGCEEVMRELVMGARSLRDLDWYKAECWAEVIRTFINKVGLGH